ncbi:endoplasmic reticulum metallopeptidase 1 [Anaeramoeba flamelloides]|uniref:Endoplasmic reticulum metallopeptidase 1 n=1 Tax=Anaeramoeba flamelloides TaxID=1746091 RepID=A0ABQ8Y1B8_9EUKA|nr:endoplasmic reticulum metallopeptidase 1 [Anaeramoeba flamelloides]
MRLYFAISILLLFLIQYTFTPKLFDSYMEVGEVAPVDAPLSTFSFHRVFDFMKSIPQGPRQFGSEAHTEAIQLLNAELDGLKVNNEYIKYEFDNTTVGSCAFLEGTSLFRVDDMAIPIVRISNTLTGSSDDTAILVSAHIDSHWTGVGANDDLVHISTMLELVRNFINPVSPSSSLKFPVVFAFLPSEEWMFDSSCVISKHPWTQNCKYIVNLEAMGTSKKKMTVSTFGPDYPWFSELLADPSFGKNHFIGSSIFPDIYGSGFVPSGTDTKVYKDEEYGPNGGLSGFDLVYVDETWAYHTPLDNFDHLYPKNIQSGGEALYNLLYLATTRLHDGQEGEEGSGWVAFFMFFGKLSVLSRTKCVLLFVLFTVLFLVILSLRIYAHTRGKTQRGYLQVAKQYLQRIFVSLLLNWGIFFFGLCVLLIVCSIQMSISRISYTFYAFSDNTQIYFLYIYCFFLATLLIWLQLRKVQSTSIQIKGLFHIYSHCLTSIFFTIVLFGIGFTTAYLPILFLICNIMYILGYYLFQFAVKLFKEKPTHVLLENKRLNLKMLILIILLGSVTLVIFTMFILSDHSWTLLKLSIPPLEGLGLRMHISDITLPTIFYLFGFIFSWNLILPIFSYFPQLIEFFILDFLDFRSKKIYVDKKKEFLLGGSDDISLNENRKQSSTNFESSSESSTEEKLKKKRSKKNKKKKNRNKKTKSKKKEKKKKRKLKESNSDRESSSDLEQESNPEGETHHENYSPKKETDDHLFDVQKDDNSNKSFLQLIKVLLIVLLIVLFILLITTWCQQKYNVGKGALFIMALSVDEGEKYIKFQPARKPDYNILKDIAEDLEDYSFTESEDCETTVLFGTKCLRLTKKSSQLTSTLIDNHGNLTYLQEDVGSDHKVTFTVDYDGTEDTRGFYRLQVCPSSGEFTIKFNLKGSSDTYSNEDTSFEDSYPCLNINGKLTTLIGHHDWEFVIPSGESLDIMYITSKSTIETDLTEFWVQLPEYFYPYAKYLSWSPSVYKETFKDL